MKNGFRIYDLFTGTMLFALYACAAVAQSSGEMYMSGGEQSPPVGPTAASQTVRLLVNSDNPTGNTVSSANTLVTVTATLSNQQFAGVATGIDSPVVMFGAGRRVASDVPESFPVYEPMNRVGSAANIYYSGVADGRPIGVDTSANAAFRLFSSVRQFAEGKPAPTNARIYLADLTLSFSSPVSDPYLHLSGLGSRIGPLAFTTELEPVTPGLSLERVAGSFAFEVTPTSIGTTLSQYTTDSCDALAGCGTVRVVGDNLTSITFRVYVRGNGGAPTWGSTADHNGDDWMLGLSLPRVHDLAGGVYYDADGPATLDGWEIGAVDGSPLYINLIDPTDSSVIGSAAVNDQGMYSFTGVPGGGTDHFLELSTQPGVPLGPAPPRTLPPGWANVGEQLRLDVKPGNDGTPDGRLAVRMTEFNYSNALFAVKMQPGSRADIYGRIFLHNSRNAWRSQVELHDPVSGDRFTAYTNQFGYYRFIQIPAGRIYRLLAVDRKRRLSQSMDLLVLANVSGADMVLFPTSPEVRKTADSRVPDGAEINFGIESRMPLFNK